MVGIESMVAIFTPIPPVLKNSLINQSFLLSISDSKQTFGYEIDNWSSKEKNIFGFVQLRRVSEELPNIIGKLNISID